jgi:hypothetical protein
LPAVWTPSPQDMTEARIEFRLDLETSSSQPFRRKPSLLHWNDGIVLTVHHEYLGEGFSFRLGRGREPARSGDDGAHRPTPGRDGVERHDGALRKAEERDPVEPPGESMLLDLAGNHKVKRGACVPHPLRTIGLGDTGDAEPLTSRTAAVDRSGPSGEAKTEAGRNGSRLLRAEQDRPRLRRRRAGKLPANRRDRTSRSLRIEFDPVTQEPQREQTERPRRLRPMLAQACPAMVAGPLADFSRQERGLGLTSARGASAAGRPGGVNPEAELLGRAEWRLCVAERPVPKWTNVVGLGLALAPSG